MKSSFAIALVCWMTLAGCASAPPMPPVGGLLRDELFQPASVPIEPDQAMALSAAMRGYLETRLRRAPHDVDRRRWLMDSLYRRGELQLEYDASTTRTAAQAFDARSGNCLALVLMTGAFAKALGLTVRFQEVIGETGFDRAGDLAISIGHVNLTLDEGLQRRSVISSDRDPWVVDFLPSGNARALRTKPIDERTVVAMFLNNRAVESLVAGRVDDAYWWAREALGRDPELLSAYVTLGVVYRQRGQPALDEAALARVNERQPENTQALANRVLALRDLGWQPEAAVLQHRLDQLDPHPRFADFDRGMAALRERRFEDARRLLEREVDRAPDYHEFHFWLAVAYASLNDPAQAAEQLARAMAVSTTRHDHDLYAGKLDRLKALQTR